MRFPIAMFPPPPQTSRMIEMFPGCYGRIDKDGSRFLLADREGRLFAIVLAREGHQVRRGVGWVWVWVCSVQCADFRMLLPHPHWLFDPCLHPLSHRSLCGPMHGCVLHHLCFLRVDPVILPVCRCPLLWSR